MTTKSKIIISIIALITAFASGRYLSPTKIQVEKQVVEVVKKEQDKQVDEKKVIVEVITPDGTKSTTTTVDSHTTVSTTIDKDKKLSESKIVENTHSKLSLSALAGLDITDPAKGYVFGVHVQKQLLGPINLGVFGMTNKVMGVSLGISL